MLKRENDRKSQNDTKKKKNHTKFSNFLDLFAVYEYRTVKLFKKKKIL